jgi:hypothetical protein
MFVVIAGLALGLIKANANEFLENIGDGFAQQGWLCSLIGFIAMLHGSGDLTVKELGLHRGSQRFQFCLVTF